MTALSPKLARLREHITEAIEYYENFRAVQTEDGVLIVDTVEGGGVMIKIEEILAPVDQQHAWEPALSPSPGPRTLDDDTPF